MSFRPLVVNIESEGLDTLADTLANAPELVIEAAERAARTAAPVARAAISAHTPVDTGFLQSNNAVFLAGPLDLVFENITHYAAFVDARTDFVERGLDSVQDRIESIYEQAIDDVAQRLSEGG